MDKYEKWWPDKLTIRVERREDGGARVYCEEVDGVVLSGAKPREVFSDIWPALSGVLNYHCMREKPNEND